MTELETIIIILQMNYEYKGHVVMSGQLWWRYPIGWTAEVRVHAGDTLTRGISGLLVGCLWLNCLHWILCITHWLFCGCFYSVDTTLDTGSWTLYNRSTVKCCHRLVRCLLVLWANITLHLLQCNVCPTSPVCRLSAKYKETLCVCQDSYIYIYTLCDYFLELYSQTVMSI